MPVSFLTAEQERRYGQFAGEPNSDQLARHFHLDDADREVIAAKRWTHMRLGYCLPRPRGNAMSDPLGDGRCFTPPMENRLTIPMRSMGASTSRLIVSH